tara:strand:+ start:224 stop:820 length:597 start_codon:yes stop_codon:yes gene_type:complete
MNLVIFGSSGHAKVIAESIVLCNEFNLLGFIDCKGGKKKIYNNYCVIGKDKDIIKIAEKYSSLQAAIGIGDINKREELSHKFKFIKFPSIVHPKTFLSKNIKMDDGCFIASSVTISNNVHIGRFVTINTAAIVDHDSKISDFTFISPGVKIAGNVTIGKRVFIGLGSNIGPNIKIGNDSIIGSGKTVLKDLAVKSRVV